MKDLEKRQRVMQRSMRLGHCICNAKKSCPCDVLLQHDVCPCAGEKLDGQAGPARLMSLVDNAGCASKIDRATLGRVLAGLPCFDDPRVLVGSPAGDDAGVYRLDAETALVETVDVFSPSADDPYVFGQIAAANSLSDVYAMGGRPITAMSIVGFPVHDAHEDALHEILRGGVDKMAEAGVAVVGGHSINDKEVKAGFAVIGLIHPDRIVTNAAARPGDRLILTKPLGTGMITFAAQIGRADPEWLDAATRSMTLLNRRAAELMIDHGVHACTDVTGFGLAGHLTAMAAASGVDVEILWDSLPLLPGVLECMSEGIASGAVERNRESCGQSLVADGAIEPVMLDVCFDPQTSGGLLLAVPPEAADGLLERLRAAGMPEAAIVGNVLETGTGRVFVRTDGSRPRGPSKGSKLPMPPPPSKGSKLPMPPPPSKGSKLPMPPPAELAPQESSTETVAMSCCEGDHGGVDETPDIAGGAAAAQRKFKEFLRASGAPGALDARTRQALALALSVLARCEPCVKIHIQKARAMGLSQEEIDEAAWMAISFGGSPVMMFYNAFAIMHVKRLVAWILVLAAGAGALVYGALYHQVPVEVEKHREISIAVPTMPVPGEMPFGPPGFGDPGGMPPEFGGPEGMPPGDSPMPFVPPPMMPGIKLETVTEKYVESQEDPEWVIVFDATIGGVARLANGQLKRTYSGKPPALCPT